MKYTLLTLLVLSSFFLVGCSTPSSIPADSAPNEKTDSEREDDQDSENDTEDTKDDADDNEDDDTEEKSDDNNQ